jgi:hypothetical protein
MSNNTQARKQTPNADPTREGTGTFIEYTDAGGTVAGIITMQTGNLVFFTAAGLAAALAQASTYLASAKVTAILATGAAITVDGNLSRVYYSCLPADAAAQTTALLALVTAANIVQTVQTVH